MYAGWHYYFETGPYLLSLAGIVGALYCKLLRTEARWNIGVIVLVLVFYYGGFFLLSTMAVRTGGALPIGVTLTYVIIGAVVLMGMIPNVASVLGSDTFKQRSDWYEWYWLIVAGIGVLLDTIHRLGWT